MGNVAARRAGLRGPAAEAAVALGSAAVAVEVFAYAERHDGSALSRMLRKPGFEIQRLIGTREPTEEQLEVGRAALEEILRVRSCVSGSTRASSASRSTRSARATTPTRTSTSPSGCWRSEDRHPRVTMQVFQKHDSLLGGIDEAIAVLKLCSDDWERLEVQALHEGDEIAPYETVMLIEGDYSLFAHLETVYLGCLARRSLVMRNVREVVEAAARQADPLLPRAPRPLARADRRRLGGPRGGCDRGLDRRPGLVVGRSRRRHGATQR